MGGWPGSALNVKTSRDEGRTWGGSRRLTLNPFLNLSSLVRNKPIHASDGRIGLPVYHELAMKFPQMLWLTPGPDGSVEEFRIRNLSTEAGLIQPTLVPVDGDRVLMVLRDHGRGGRRVHTAYSDDNGWTWSGAEPSGLPNPDSAIDALRGQRCCGLQPWVAWGAKTAAGDFSDDGRTWRPGPVIETDARQSFRTRISPRINAADPSDLYVAAERTHVEFHVAAQRWVAEQMGTQ